MKISDRQLHIITAGLILLILIFLMALINRNIVFGSVVGRWFYPYKQGLTLSAIVICIIAAIVSTTVYLISVRYIHSHTALAIFALIMFGFGYTAWLYPRIGTDPLAVIVGSGSSPFLNQSRAFTPRQLVSGYHSLSPYFPAHGKANMPGKTLFYYPLRFISDTNHNIWLMTVLVSSVIGVLVFYLSLFIFNSKETALLSLVLYLTLPAKLFFAPLLNTISPLFSVLSLLFLVFILKSKKVYWAILLGVSLYVMIFFEPMLMAIGLIGVVLVMKNIAGGILSFRELVLTIMIVFLSFLISYKLVLWLYNFDLAQQYVFILLDSINFNRLTYRGYLTWIFQNPLDFVWGAGVAPSALILLSWGALTVNYLKIRQRYHIRFWKIILSRMELLLTLAFVITLVLVNFFGVARGESIRLWIFLMVIWEILAARYAIIAKKSLLVMLLIWGNVIQSVLTLSVVKFI
ncbi:hypothetical protein A2154_03415 [Candidatus Gottesmanbacteria bacterium RBG_16_43_7]|uniref:Glycosyltransferase RgtA/B/C/D-like domain-containing protein n=1 Tax=Candidatus Gottesmanbacteria bacterium RBG_16_43_7 TaxID=1798373 RepID=A0A1F5Z9M7_9BACT|nr:MAG: hypothetical protein A2154_03415 [Candidatus Gottesmanbacteria bacterium RBG_16_43_7]